MLEFPPVITKRDFVERFDQGEFGNKLPTWDCIDSLVCDYSSGKVADVDLVHIRNRIAGGRTWYNVPMKYVGDVYRSEVIASGLAPHQVYFSLMAPTARTLFQGEVMQSEHSLELYWTNVAKPMRDALAERAYRDSGIIAVSLLRYYLDAPSFDWLQALLERYPGHVVEFSAYSVCCGTLGLNTIFWEVRGGY